MRLSALNFRPKSGVAVAHLTSIDSGYRRTIIRKCQRTFLCAAMSCLLAFAGPTSAATVRDNFDEQVYNANDGTVNWSGDWVEVDGEGGGPNSGNVWINAGLNELRLEDRPNTGGTPSATREANLLGATSARWNFDWRTTGGVDASDAVVAEVSADGGGAWAVLETFTDLVGVNSGSRSYDILPYASANTQIRFRVTNLYDGGNESFHLAYVEIDFDIIPVGAPSLLVLKASATIEDPASGTTNPKSIPDATMRYLVMTTNSGTGPVDADSFVITDPIPANTALRVVDFDGVTSGPVQFVDGTPVSGLTYTFVALGDPGDDVSFSNDGGATNTYTPTADANGVNTTVTNIRIDPKGAFLGDTGSGDPSFEAYFKTIVQRLQTLLSRMLIRLVLVYLGNC